MSHTPHELAEDFPDYVDKISQLQQNNPHFTRLADDYHVINRAIHRAETNVEPVSDGHILKMRKSRMHLKDQIYKYLAKA